MKLLSVWFCGRMEAGLQKVLQVDLEVNGLVDPLGTRSVTWQVEYPMSRTFSEEIPTLIRLAAHDLGSIVPLAMVSSASLIAKEFRLNLSGRVLVNLRTL